MRMTSSMQDTLWRAVQQDDFTAYRQSMESLKLVPSPRPGVAGPSIPVRLFVRQDQHAEGLLSLWDVGFATSRPVGAAGSDGKWTTLAECLLQLVPACCCTTAVQSPDAAAADAPGTGSTDLTQASSLASITAADDPGNRTEAGNTAAGAAAERPGVPGTDSTSDKDASPAEPGSSGQAAEGADTAGASDAAILGPKASQISASQIRLKGRCWVAGTQPPLEAPLAWWHANLHSADGFLYIVVIADVDGG